ncbi:MAG: transposase [Anaerolineaceae bacterium]|nr:transposase [Anaerolineaceae bacterium]
MQKPQIQQNQIYHIYNRGVNREPIFFKEKNWDYFLYKTFQYFRSPYAEILAYCLMPNHYHLLVNVLCQDFGIKVILPFSTAYTKAINNQEHRVGPIFQGSYKFKQITTSEELVYVSRYIHLNPVKAGLVRSPKDWAYSSYLDYIGERTGDNLKKDLVLDNFAEIENYRDFVENSN